MSNSRRQRDRERIQKGSLNTVFTDNRGWVNLNDVNPNDEIVIKGISIRGRDIPVSIYTLDCGHTGKGFGVSQAEVLFCDVCKSQEFVTGVR